MFQNSDSTILNINSFMVQGWFFIRCSGGDFVNFFSVILQGQQILSVSFSTSPQRVRQTVLSQNVDKNVNAIAFNVWFLIKSQISVQSNSIIAQTSVHNQGNLFLTNIISQPQNFNQLLSKKDITLEIGNSSQNPGILESCAYSKNIFINWDANIDDSKTLNYADDYTAIQTQLVWNFDFFYTKSNPNQYFNTAQSMKLYSNQYNLGNSQFLLIKSGTEFKTDYVNPLDFGGLVITFHFKLSSLSTSDTKLFQILNQQSQILISIDSSSTIKLNAQIASSVTLNQWNQVTLIIKSVILNKAYLIVNTFDNQVQQININQQFLLGQLQFGDISNTQDISFSHIRYYKGTFLTSNQGNCLLQNSREIFSCIICKPGFFINYQSSLNCDAQTLPSKNVSKDNIIDWNENFQSCPQGMVYDSVTFKCSCLNQFYMTSDNKCAKCPKYCNGCINESTCIEQDPLRFSNGSCPQGYFDDGFSCFSQKLTILSKNNIVKTFQQPNLNPICSQTIATTDYTLTDSDLNLSSSSSYQFLISFSYLFQNFSGDKSIAVFRDGTNELFTFSTKVESGNQNIVLEVQGQVKYKASLLTSQVVWIAFWTDLKQITLLIQSYSEYFFKTINININQKLNNPSFCVGPCKSVYHPSGYLCGNLQDRPLIFIRNVTNPISDMISLQMFLSNPTVNVAVFKIDINSNLAMIYSNQLTSNPSLLLNFQSTPVLIHKLKGFGFNKQVKAVVQNINISGYYWISFYCTIIIETINSQVSLLSYNLNGGKVEYLLIPYGQKILIRICYITSCIDTKYSMLNMDQSNNLFILMRLQSPFSGGIHFIEFDIICNYLREQIQFLSVSFTVSMPTLNLNIGLQTYNTEDYLFYLNLISIDKGDGLYYFDYNPSENCFIFSNLDQMKCIYYKNNLITYQNSVITVEQCQQLNSSEQTFFISNLQTRECINSNKSFPGCLVVDLVNSNLQCIQCKKNNADPQNNCNCIEGYYLDSKQQLCLNCDPTCKACNGKRDNCTQCKYSNQIAPSCNCIQPNYFLDQNQQCQKCSQQCESCVMTKDSCLQCSLNRTNPPLCSCDYNNFVEINGVCTKLICDDICDKCQYDISSNKVVCLKCKSGRLNLPLCSCMPNYVENPDGTCSACPSSFYYDLQTKQCEACQFPCLQCINSNNQCTSCYSGLELINQTCSCGIDKELLQISGGSTAQFVCIQAMKVKLAVTLQISNYLLIFTFDSSLAKISFEQNPLNSLIQIKLQDVPSSYYSFDNPQINENRLTIQMNVYTSFQATYGTAIFLQTNIFVSEDNRFILSSYYQLNPIQFKIGPFIFTDSVTQKNMVAVMNNLQSSQYQNILNIIQQTQILFYLLNTAQPTLLFLLLKATFPPNLYIFYQIFGTFVFPGVVNYSSTDYKQSYSVFGLEFDKKQVFLTDNEIFKRVGFSNTFLVNTFLVLVKYFVLITIYVLVLIISQFHFFFSQSNKVYILKAKSKILQRLNTENEANLLIIFVSILQQFTSFQQELWSVRYGYYLAIAFLMVFIVSFYRNLVEINNLQLRNEYLYSFQFINRLPKDKSKLTLIGRNYFLIQLIKKYLAIIVLFSLQNSPYAVCAILGLIFLISSMITIYYRPYSNLINRMIKITGELIFSTVWFLHIYILVIEDQLSRQQQFQQSTIETYLNVGNIAIVLLLIFNMIFLFDIFISLFSITRNLCKKKESKQLQLDQEQQQQEDNQELLQILKENLNVKQSPKLFKKITFKNFQSIEAKMNKQYYSSQKTINNKQCMDSL